MTSCRSVRLRLPTTRGEDLPPPSAAHLAACLSCQAEAARYRALARRLAGLQVVTAPAPFNMAVGVDRGTVRPTGGRRRWVRMAEAVAAAVTGAVAAGVGAYAVLRVRRGPAAG